MQDFMAPGCGDVRRKRRLRSNSHLEEGLGVAQRVLRVAHVEAQVDAADVHLVRKTLVRHVPALWWRPLPPTGCLRATAEALRHVQWTAMWGKHMEVLSTSNVAGKELSAAGTHSVAHLCDPGLGGHMRQLLRRRRRHGARPQPLRRLRCSRQRLF